MNLATALSREIARSVEVLDLSLQSALRAINAPAFKTTDPVSRHQSLFDGSIEAKHIGSMFVINPDGQIIYDSAGLLPRQASVADRDFFLVHKYNTIAGRYISRPYMSRVAHEWSIAISRRINGADGAFAGIVVASIRYPYFAELFSKLDLGENGAITLLSDTGTMIYRMPFVPDELGQDFSDTSLFAHLRSGQTEPYEGVARSTGLRMLFAVSRVGDLPLILSVNIPLATVYADWQAKSLLVGGALLVLLLTGAFLLHAVNEQQNRRITAEQRALAMSEQNRRDAERHHANKLEAVGRLTAGIGHDFNNYLQTITSSLEIIAADYLHEPEALEVVRLAHKAANSGSKLTQRLMTFSRQQVLQPRRLSVAFLLSDIGKLVEDAAILETAIHCTSSVEPFTADLWVDQTQVESCLLNLLLNARDAMPGGGRLTLQGRNAGPEDALFGRLTPGHHVIITVSDSGRGMDEETRAHAFEPFYTTKAFGQGAGLGLSMAQGFCHQSGGDIRILENADAPGTSVQIWLPAADKDMRLDDEIEVNYATIGRRTGRILLVEDEHDVLVSLSTILVSGGFEVVSVLSGADGLIRLHDREPFDAVLTDYHMPDMTGAEFLAGVASHMPDIPMLMLSGGSVDDLALTKLPRPVRLLRKPIRRMGLLNAVREVIGENTPLLTN